MGRKNRTPENQVTDVNSQEYWDQVLASQGMPADLPSDSQGLKDAGHKGHRVVSFEAQRDRIFYLQEELDKEVTFENQHPSALPVSRCGLPPCLRVRNGRDGS